ncbi:hypothetical protein FQN60_016004 [Etheostoma spectabile]|uniref:Uncharacterized protein n=1 Tax=Etheostoma spectabile TaxID=54343 RepID=A0A5J5C6E6_9PERO|nr:hypothetical protein FQN60_016004 [Etheostoma spectabile]
MSHLEEEEDGAESGVPGWWSMKSDRSRREPLNFSKELGPPDTKLNSQREEERCS